MRYLHFGSVRGDLQEDHVYDKRLCGYASRCQFPLFPVPIPFLPSTKSGVLCAFGLRNPHFQSFRAQNRGFCAFCPSGTLVFGLFEHIIGIFVRFGGATARSNGSNGSNRSNGNNENNCSNGNNRSNRNDGRDSLVSDILSQRGVV